MKFAIKSLYRAIVLTIHRALKYFSRDFLLRNIHKVVDTRFSDNTQSLVFLRNITFRFSTARPV